MGSCGVVVCCVGVFVVFVFCVVVLGFGYCCFALVHVCGLLFVFACVYFVLLCCGWCDLLCFVLCCVVVFCVCVVVCWFDVAWSCCVCVRLGFGLHCVVDA